MPRRDAIVRWLQLGWLGSARIAAYARILLLVSLVSFGESWRQATGATGSDFLAFWSAGKLAAAGRASQSYDLGATGAIQAALGRHDVFAFVNPPPLLLAVWPFGLLPFGAGWAAWIVSTYAAWFLAARRLDRRLRWPIAAWPGALVAAWHAQTGLLTGALTTAFATLLRRRPVWAGLCVGALVIKPHLALLFPIALAAGRHWRAFWSAAAGAALLLTFTALVFGPGTLLAYPRSWAISRHLMNTGDAAFFLRQCTVYAAIRVAISPGAGALAQALVSLGVGVATWRVWSGPAALEGKLAFLMAAVPLATPYLFNYDLPFLIVPTVWLIGEARERSCGDWARGGWERPLLLLFYLAPLWTRALALPLGANLAPWVEIAMAMAVWRRLAP